MSALSDIAVNIEASTGNVQPLLHEIRHALGRLARDEAGTIIDLRGLPLAPGEESKIEEALGQGEVVAELDALGPSTVRETAYSGVWFVTHRNAEGEIIARFIEVSRVPEILMAQPEDIRLSVEDLTERLESGEAEAGQ